MANAPFPPMQGDFESLARQYWNTWNELLGRNATQDGWSRLVGGLPPGMARMDAGNFDWFSRMQQLAGRFGDGGGASAADIARAWREMLGGNGAPFAGALHAMHGVPGAGAWLDQVRPLLDVLLRPLRQQQAEWLQRPAFGPAREHQERLQSLALAWQQWEQRNQEFNELLARAGQAAFERFERLLAEHDAPGKRLQSARALFDLWIDAAEEAWAGIAMSDEYRHAYAEMTNALMRLRLGLQREVEQFGGLLGMPGRAEVDALHRKVADLERALHAARRAATTQAGTAPKSPARPQAQRATGTRAAGAGAPTPGHAPVRAGQPARAEAPEKQAARTMGARKTGTKKTAAKKATARKAIVKKTAAKKAAARKVIVKKTSAKKATVKTAPAKKVVVKTSTPKKVAAKKTVARKTVAKKVAAKKTPAKRPAAKAAPAKKAPALSARDALPASPATSQGQVVSMKDWVSRNIAQAPQDAVRRGGRKP